MKTVELWERPGLSEHGWHILVPAEKSRGRRLLLILILLSFLFSACSNQTETIETYQGNVIADKDSPTCLAILIGEKKYYIVSISRSSGIRQITGYVLANNIPSGKAFAQITVAGTITNTKINVIQVIQVHQIKYFQL